MALDLFHAGGNAAGNMTSGGTESCMIAIKTARDYARAHRPEIERPEVILPVSAHPAFEKGVHYFGVKVVRAPLDENYQVDVGAVREAITENTILLVGSAPSYPHGILDPIAELGQVAVEHNLLFHVDACMGGFMLPFVQRLGYPLPDFDFGVPGVTSLSADLHKYGYAAKGASLILYRDREVRRQQFFVTMDWPGGIYASPTMTGTRPGGAIAAAWAVMKYLGEAGYVEIADRVMKATVQLKEGIRAFDDLYILGDPAMSVFAIASDTLNIFEVADELSLRGWFLDRQQNPDSLHMTVNHAHTETVDLFLSDLAEAIARVRKPSLRKTVNKAIVGAAQAATQIVPESIVSRLMDLLSPLIAGSGPAPFKRSAPMYGMLGSLPNRGDLKEVVLDLVEGFTEVDD
jgi:glutamate/tyrosine decarboxylase-like PLP-dependent enzyme